MYGLAAHRKNEHKDIGENVSCTECQKTFQSNMALSTHIANVHERNPCHLCGEMIPKYEANRHFRKKHTGTEIQSTNPLTLNVPSTFRA